MYYQKGSHPVMSQVTEIALLIEEEYKCAHSVFQLTEQNPQLIAIKVCEKLIQKLSEILEDCEKELTQQQQLKPFLVLLDTVETLHETMKESFIKLIKIKDFPLKRAVETVLLRCQSFMVNLREYISEQSQSGSEFIDNKILNDMMLMTEVSKFPKAYKMIEFVNKQIKQENQKFNFYNDLVECVKAVEAKKEQLKKQYAHYILKLKYQIDKQNLISEVHVGYKQLWTDELPYYKV